MKYKQDWILYFKNINGKRSSFYMDLGLIQIAPVNGMQNFLYVSVKMNDPLEDGLSSSGERQTLLQIEDKLVNALKVNHNVIYIGRITSDGKRHFHFYTRETILIDKSVSESFLQFPGYEYNFELLTDKEWDHYFGFIYPELHEMHQEMAEHIDGLENQPSELNHWIYFKSNESLQKFIERVMEEGFRIEDIDADPDADKEFRYSLKISRVDNEHHHLDDCIVLLWELADELGGRYGGWEASFDVG